MKIFKKEDNHLIGMVTMEEKEDLAIIPWTEEWFYYCYGKSRVGCVTKEYPLRG